MTSINTSTCGTNLPHHAQKEKKNNKKEIRGRGGLATHLADPREVGTAQATPSPRGWLDPPHGELLIGVTWQTNHVADKLLNIWTTN
jgi:hypothetical protein